MTSIRSAAWSGGIGPRAPIASASVCAPSSSSIATQVSSPRLPDASTLRDAGALHALELLELALEPLRDARQRDDGGRDELDDAGLAGRLVGRAMDRAGAASAELLAPSSNRDVSESVRRGLRLQGHEPGRVDGAEVRVVAELLLALGAELHRSGRIPETRFKDCNVAHRLR